MASHAAAEIYHVPAEDGIVHLAGNDKRVRPGSVGFIPWGGDLRRILWATEAGAVVATSEALGVVVTRVIP